MTERQEEIVWGEGYRRGKADAEAKIVYCIDCKWHISNLGEDNSDEDYLRCPMKNASASGGDYCSRGERK